MARQRFELVTAPRYTGWTVLTVGVLLLGFVVYKLLITSLLAGRAQAGLTVELDERIATVRAEAVAYEQGDLELAVVPIVMPDDLAMPGEVEIAATLQTSAGYASTVAAAPGEPTSEESSASAPAPPPPAPSGMLITEPAAPPGDALGRIEIASIDLDWTIVEGVSSADLRTGAGHMPDTAMPGQPGNTVISGHRTTYGAPFRNLAKTRKGDLITVTTASGSHVYQIVEKRVVLPNETWVTGQWEGSWLTLTTCHPTFSARERLIVFARLVGGPNAGTLVGGA